MALGTKKLAVIGASDMIGREILQIFSEKGWPHSSIVALSPERMPGLDVSYGEDDVLPIQSLESYDVNSLALVIVAPPYAVKDIQSKLPATVKIIDAYGGATNPDVPVLLPGVTRDANQNENTIAAPQSVTTPLAYALKTLHDTFGIDSVVVTGMLATVHKGRTGMDELFAQTRSIYVNDAIEKDIFSKQIAFNLVPEVGAFMPDGALDKEWQMAVQVKRLISPKISVVSHLAYAPLYHADAFCVSVECEKECDSEAALAAFRASPHLSVVDLRADGGTITPVEVAGEDKIFVSRVRDTGDNGLSFWITADAVRASLAMPVVRLAESILMQ